MSGLPSNDREPQDAPVEHVTDPTAIPASSPYATGTGTGTGTPAYGSAPGDEHRPYAVVPPSQTRGGLTQRTAKFLTSIAVFVALILFFVLSNAHVPFPAWLAFLLIPLTGLVTEQLRTDR
ncbi:hypothetical protein C8046_13065 [Serinibacter arcticus]|uniref:Uncharacterized protein n=1 Tax=Serinibacter arcticus TaxID=1655435 RepID=A0A2U1ZWT6_9MICO|nr:hypothetical protein [Serinibacter arcticus]PWD51448.1 hypothetical protein C8046_13065 [Serinibacter arcticus]